MNSRVDLSSRGRPPIGTPLPRLDSVDNFRDLAGRHNGYWTPRGRLRGGVFFRSNRIDPSPADLSVLASLGITGIHDLREQHEISRHPDVELPGASWIHHPVPGIPQKEVENFDTADDTLAAMLENYRTFVSDDNCRDGFSSLFQALAHSQGPQLFHCSAGKDRTGWATILLHHIAGVRDEDIVADYLMTDEYAVASRKAMLDLMVEHLGELRLPAYDPALRCSTAYLRVAYVEANNLFGGVDGYLREGLRLSVDDISRLQHRLIDPT